MSECMMFPNDWAKFLEDYSFRDDEEIYTNGSRLIPVFRVEQLIEHYFATDNNDGRWIPVTEHEPEIDCITVDDLGQIVLARRISVITLPTKEKIYLANDKAEEIMSCLGDGDTLINCTHITHWMPLPEPPKEEDNAM